MGIYHWVNAYRLSELGHASEQRMNIPISRVEMHSPTTLVRIPKYIYVCFDLTAMFLTRELMTNRERRHFCRYRGGLIAALKNTLSLLRLVLFAAPI